MKVESHRLGYEMSEDALSWNVFVSLSVAGKLRQTAEFLTGRKLLAEPLLIFGDVESIRSAGHTQPINRCSECAMNWNAALRRL